ncbi:MAG TPA: RNA polymerase sigma factor [Myxococcales bacterium]|nr:RNA polymerase sigma factor [Myxococcales bacterium]
MAQERTDEELLAAYQQGDPGAFEALLRRHRAPLFTFLLRMLGDREKAEDLAQETFLRIVKGAQAWERRARFQTWLYTIARNLCVDQSRRDRFRRAESLDAQGPEGDPPLSESVPGKEIDPGRGAESARLRPLLQKALLELPAEQREVFVLREQAGLPFREIAETTGVNENTVKSRMRYALLGLRKALLAAGVSEETAADEPEKDARLGRA